MYLLNNLFYLIILLGITLPAQELGEMTIYNTDNSGLTYNQINCIEFDGENRLWAGTEDGLSIFNEFNNNWDNVYQKSPNSTTPWSGLKSNTITSLEWDNEQTMFIGTPTGITDVWWETGNFGNNGQEANWSLNFGNSCIPNNGIITTILHNNNSSQIWAGSTDGLCIEGLGPEGSWLMQNTKTGFYSNNITDINQSITNDMIAIGTMNGGLITYSDEFNIYYSSNSDILDNTVLDVVFDQNNNIIICTPQAGLGVLTENGSWIWFNTINSDLPTNSLRNIIVDNNNNLWITTLENGLVHYKDNVFYNYTTENSDLPDNNINCLKIGPNNHLWLGTDTAGIVKISNPGILIDEVKKISSNIWPSIFKDAINIQSEKDAIINIINQQGKLVSRTKCKDGINIINTSNYKPSLYLIMVEYKTHISINKIIKP
ncbi:MAG: hypothetical protein CMP50_01185 [Flavobacteriales bacterium]|nr:hypothetical protein [Flavobacteriales bacterium]